MKTSYLLNQSSISILKSLIGKKLNYIEHEQFSFTPAVYGICYINVDSKDFAIESKLKYDNYFLCKEEVAQFNINSDVKEKVGGTVNALMIREKIDRQISKIIILNANCQIHEHGKILDEIDVSYGIVIELSDGYQVSFDRTFDFTEIIGILKGYDLSEKIKYCEDPNEGWEDDQIAKYTPSVTFSKIIIK